tara:strand:+ start:9075 stop:9692 length:618 start_codon:yes stop_codon:yes gene_type:complete
MDLFITSKNGNLVQNQKFLKDTKLFIPEEKFLKGDLKTTASIKNIQSVCESILSIFIRPMGFFPKDSKLSPYYSIDIGKKYINGECPPYRTNENLTRGWSYLVAGVIHRFFYNNYDLYKVPCPLDKKNRDYHWWLESKCRNYIIDLTEEQYLKEGIIGIRSNGLKTNSIGHLYGKKTSYMAFLIATYKFKDAIIFKDIKSSFYIK